MPPFKSDNDGEDFLGILGGMRLKDFFTGDLDDYTDLEKELFQKARRLGVALCYPAAVAAIVYPGQWRCYAVLCDVQQLLEAWQY